MKPKLYKSEAYLRTQYVIKGKTVEEIAKELGVSYNTIRESLRAFKLLRS
jgi:transposase